MANVQIKSEILTPFGGIFPIMDQFNALLAQTGENGTYPPTRNIIVLSLWKRVLACILPPTLSWRQALIFTPFYEVNFVGR